MEHRLLETRAVWGLPVAAFLQFAFAGALLYYVRKHADSLRETYYATSKRMGRLYPIARAYDWFGLVAAVGVFVLAGRHHGWGVACAFVAVSFLVSLCMQLILGWMMIRRWSALSTAGLVLVPLCFANAAILVSTAA
ncbi:MAG TPA: hypothetical protein VHB25_12805 [Gemmatimonadaceae bacterium]|nr:hypothetical protein [Gemmatimonadaceae bacterium]